MWEDPENARKVMKAMASLQEDVDTWQTLSHRLTDALELAQLGDDSLYSELEAEIDSIEAQISNHEFKAMLSGVYDRGNALLAIHAGAGGTDSQDWQKCWNACIYAGVKTIIMRPKSWI